MNELISKDSFTSLELVELINQFRVQEGSKSSLRHSDFLNVIRDEFSEEINERKISSVKYLDKKGEERPMFILDLKQSRQVLVRESRQVRKAVIAYIDELERQLSLQAPKTLKEALILALEQQERLEVLALENAIKDQQIAELKPKADYMDMILKNKSLLTITQIAKDYGMSGNAMNKILRQLGVQYKQSGQWFLYSKYHHLGYTSSETVDIVRSDGKRDVKMNTKWTLKGRIFLYKLLKEEGVLPMIEKEIVA
jgi:prophage antirepressor|nr:MAG TPA: KilAC domain protein [Caudoviricetes sp.]